MQLKDYEKVESSNIEFNEKPLKKIIKILWK